MQFPFPADLSLTSMRTHRYRPAVLAALLCAITIVPASAQQGPATAFSVLRIEPSARGAALAGAASAVYGDDVNTLFYNPALLSASAHRALSVTYLNHLAGVDGGFAAYAHDLEEVGTVGAGLRYVGWGQIDGYDASGDATGDFRASDAALTLSLARSGSERVRYGASLHSVFSSIDSFSASALAADLGVAYLLPARQLTLSASVNHVGVVLSRFGETRDALPTDVRLGVSKRLEYLPLLLSVTAYNLNHIGREDGSGSFVGDAMRHAVLGGEFQFSDAFNIRFGYNHRRHQDLKVKSRLDMAGLGLGFGIKVAAIRLDYAYNSWSSLGGLHHVTLRTVL